MEKNLIIKEFIQKAKEIHGDKYDYSKVEYVNSKRKVCIICSEHSEFWKTPSHHINGKQGCFECSKVIRGKKKRLKIEKVQEIGLKKDLILLSKEYKNSDYKLKWKCKNCDYEFIMSLRSIKKKQKCCKCSLINIINTFIMNINKNNNNNITVLIINKYSNNFENLNCKCNICNYEFKRTFRDLKKNKKCPVCSRGVSEEICRYYFEQIFNKKFIKVRPDWLKNSRNKQMELDGLCNNVAFEHQGVQHYEHIKYFQRNKENFEQRIKDDMLKKELCEKNNIKLIVIPDINSKLKLENLKNFIIEECKKQNIELPENIEKIEIDMNNFKHSRCKKELEKIQEIAESKNGKCLSEVYYGSNNKLLFECKNDHQWKATPTHIKRGVWCPVCANNKSGESQRLTIEDMQKLAEEKGGKCLSEKYINTTTKLRWQCSKGHIWNAQPNNVKTGNWCPYCAGKYKTITDMQKLASTKGGNCLSEHYITAKTKLLWECEKGHQWMAFPDSITRGTWCFKCSNKSKNNL